MPIRESGGLCEVRGAMFGLPGSGPHISRIERRRGSLAAMGKPRDVRRRAGGSGQAGAMAINVEKAGEWPKRVAEGCARRRRQWRRLRRDEVCGAEHADCGAVGLKSGEQWMADAAAGEDDCGAHDVSQRKEREAKGWTMPMRRMRPPQSGHVKAAQVLTGASS